MEPLTSLYAIQARNKSAGYHWFDPDTMRSFSSRVHQPVFPLPDGSALFISSERFRPLYGYPEPRAYTIRRASPDGSLDTVGEFQAYKSLNQARTQARKLAGWLNQRES